MNNDLIRVGSIWIHEHTEFILAQVSNRTFALINLNNGNRWSEPVQVTYVNDVKLPLCIPESEFKKVLGTATLHEFKFSCDPI